MGIQEKRNTGCEIIDSQATLAGRLNVGDAIRESKRHLLDGGGTRLANVITTDGNGIPLRSVLAAKRAAVTAEYIIAAREKKPSGRESNQEIASRRPLTGSTSLFVFSAWQDRDICVSNVISSDCRLVSVFANTEAR